MKKTNCKKHPDKVSVAACSRCFAPVCTDCKQMDGLHPICVDCKASSKAGSSMRSVLVLLGVVAAGGIGYWAYASGGHAPPPAPAAAADANKPKSFSNLDDLGTNPCDQKKAYAVVDKLLQSGENKGVIEKVDAINAKCKPWAPFRQLTYKAHQQLGEMDKAEADLNELMKYEPDNITFHLWRGIFFEDIKKPEKAVEDYIQAFLITPKIAGEMPGRLSKIYEKDGKICSALYPLRQQVALGTDKGYEAPIRARIEELEGKGGCEVSGSGSAAFEVEKDAKDAKVPRAKLKVAEKETAVFGIDSNLAYVVISNALATKLGLTLGEDMIVKFNKEKKAGKLVSLPMLGLSKLETKDVPAVVLDNVGEGVDGVVGQSLLVRFEVRPEGEGMVLSVRPKSGAAPAASGSAAPAAGAPK